LACKTASFITDANIATISFDPVKPKVILNTFLNSVYVKKKTYKDQSLTAVHGNDR